LAVRANLADSGDVEHLALTSVDRFGGIDVVVNNAAATMTPIAIERAGGLDELVKGTDEGTTGTPSIVSLDRSGWLRQFDTNLHGPFTLIQAALPSMRERGGGVIVNMTSMAGDLSPGPPPSFRPAATGGAARVASIPDRIGYAASKAALNRLANVIATELRQIGVAIINVDPGYARNETVSLMGELGVVDADAAIPLDIPVKTIVYAITCDDPMVYTGTVLRAAQFVRANQQ
jgi:NAD(P)-dependent dehydrogenase (short-subunit alcohol dehydrogenase family)